MVWEDVWLPGKIVGLLGVDVRFVGDDVGLVRENVGCAVCDKEDGN